MELAEVPYYFPPENGHLVGFEIFKSAFQERNNPRQ